MIRRAIGAFVRGLLVVAVLAVPLLVVGGATVSAAQLTGIVALVASVFVFSEYASVGPSLIEFRWAPPYNRLRFGALFLTVVILSLALTTWPSLAGLQAWTLGIVGPIAVALDFPFSPIWMFAETLPPNASNELRFEVQLAASISYLLSLLAMAIFVLMVRSERWPGRRTVLNLWVNLPVFDPTSKTDIVDRLKKDATVNLILGFSLPFLLPVVAMFLPNIVEGLRLGRPQALIWTSVIWAYLPASLLMRGIALDCVAGLVAAERARKEAREMADA